MNTLPEKYVITIGRQMGSGGRMIGRKIAERLGIGFYDKELLLQAAQASGLSADFFERNDERRPHFLSGFFGFNMGLMHTSLYDGTTNISDDALYKAQCDFMHRIAAQGPCVIVGRTADYVLRDVPNVVNLFIHATADDCIKRIMERDSDKTHETALAYMEKTNKLRAGYYNFYTDKKWGDAAAYDLTINSSVMNPDAIVDLVVAYLQARFNK